MQMLPFFPPLRPQSVNRLWLEGSYINEETQASRYEREHQNWRDSIKNAAADLQPLGKVLTMPGIETDDEDGKYKKYKNKLDFMLELSYTPPTPASLIWDSNDDSEDSDSHDDEDEETNERVISGAPQDFYSMVEDTSFNEDAGILPLA